MNTLFHKLALYTASILISSLPFTAMVAEADDKVKKQHTSKVNHTETATRDQNSIFNQNRHE